MEMGNSPPKWTLDLFNVFNAKQYNKHKHLTINGFKKTASLNN